MPAVAGGWRKGMDRRGAAYLPLTAEVVAAHLVGDVFIGLYPLLPDNTCHFLVADFDGPAAMLDALAYVKAARASGVPAALEISQSGRGAHVWVFFTDAVPAAVARAVGTVAAARGDGAARVDGPALVRPAVPQPGRAARGRLRQPDRRAAAGPAPQATG